MEITLSERHQRLADLMLARPHLTGEELARVTGYGRAYVAQVVRADTFRTYIEQRRASLRARLEDRMVTITHKAMDHQEAVLDTGLAPPTFIRDTIDMYTKDLGYGQPRQQEPTRALHIHVAAADLAAARALIGSSETSLPDHSGRLEGDSEPASLELEAAE